MRGFTLVELMVSLAIVGVLSAAALPTYQGVVHRSQRTDARLALLWIQYQQERHYAVNNTYADSLTGLSTPAVHCRALLLPATTISLSR